MTALPVSFQIVYVAQLLPQVMVGTQTCNGLEFPTFRFEGESGNQYTTIASRRSYGIKVCQDLPLTQVY